jgi:hypothetical protein
MHRKSLLVALAMTLRLSSLSGALTVNPPLPITHQVSIQLIQTALDNGSSPAPMFGDPTREAGIKSIIDSIWAQAGIDIHFLPNVVRYNNTFANQGLGLGVRPIEDLSAIVLNAGTHGGILNPNPSVINMFLVNVAPGFDLKPLNWVNGAGLVGANGIAAFIGSSTSAEHAAHWLAHEIGHNLGLHHTAYGTANLMSNSKNTELLTSEQIGAIFQTQGREDNLARISPGGTGFPQPLSAPIAGDFGRNNMVDASDYAIWRNSVNSKISLTADGNKNGVVDAGDLTIWRSNFGKRSAAATSEIVASESAHNLAASPEPGSAVLLICGMALLLHMRRCRVRPLLARAAT